MYCGVIGSRNSQPTGSALAEHLEQQSAGDLEAGVDVAGPVEVRIVDQTLPADRRARLLEVHAHRDQQVRGQALGLGAEPRGVLATGDRVVDAAGADDDEQAVVLAVEDRVGAGAAGEQDVGARVVERQLVEQLLRGEQRHQPLDPLVADGVWSDCAGGGHHFAGLGLGDSCMGSSLARKDSRGVGESPPR